MEALCARNISTGLPTGRIGSQVLVVGTVGSTNDLAAQYASQTDCNGLVVLAEHQTAGRGRSGNRWHCGHGQGILCSAVIPSGQIAPETISLAAAIACAEAIGPQAMVKWPNDIVLAGKKVSGILVEARTIGLSRLYIVGIGINCHQQDSDIPAWLRSGATSIYLATGTYVDRNALARRLLFCLDHWTEVAARSVDRIQAAWRQRCMQLGQRLTIAYKGRHYSGTCIGVDARYGLALHLDEGAVRLFESCYSHVIQQGQPNPRRPQGNPTALLATR